MSLRAALVVGALAIAALTPVPAAGAAANEQPPLPDLDQEAPGEFHVASMSGAVDRWWLGFSSAVSNVGNGPLVIEGHRPDVTAPAMIADQRLGGPGGVVVEDVGRLRYVTSPDHEHWHLMRFERYELRRVGGGKAIVRDRKTGFCLGDRFALAGPAPPAAPTEPVYTSRCGLRQRRLLHLSEGISVGYGDLYSPFLEYQQLPLDGLRNGRYLLVHRVNVAGRLREASMANNRASVLLRITWRRHHPRIRVLRTCADSAGCRPRTSPAIADGRAVPVGRRGLPAGTAALVCRLPAPR
jgi:hypothetical protein